MLRATFLLPPSPSDPPDGLPDTQVALPGILAIYQALWLASQAFQLSSIPSCWPLRPTGWLPAPPYSPPDQRCAVSNRIVSKKLIFEKKTIRYNTVQRAEIVSLFFFIFFSIFFLFFLESKTLTGIFCEWKRVEVIV